MQETQWPTGHGQQMNIPKGAQKGRPLRVWFVWSIWFVLLLDPEKANKPNKRDRPNNGLLTLANYFRNLLEAGRGRMMCPPAFHTDWWLG
jgi:hypothetical protein